MHLASIILWKQICTSRPLSSDFGDSFGDHFQETLQAIIERGWRCTWWPQSSKLTGCDRARSNNQFVAMLMQTVRVYTSEFGDIVVSHDHANMVAVIQRVWQCTWRPWSCKLWAHHGVSWEIPWEAMIGRVGDALGYYDSEKLEIHLETETMQTERCTFRQQLSEIEALVEGDWSQGGRSRRWLDGRWEYIQWLTRNHGHVESCVQHSLSRDERSQMRNENWEMRNERWGIRHWLRVGECQSWDRAVLGLCRIRCMLWLVETQNYCMYWLRRLTWLHVLRWW